MFYGHTQTQKLTLVNIIYGARAILKATYFTVEAKRLQEY